ncbi:MGMT family protein [Candidatus Woesearchaeota archaeon]|nr:MGMT family protein [Candidatus Woesearchaeota archaeon]
MANPFHEKIYKLLRKVPKGRVTTYKALAEAAGTKAYRAVGQAMNKNPYGILNCKGENMVPCHRVVDSKCHLHGFAHGLKKKKELLEKEGIRIENNKIVDFEKILHKF